MRNILQNRIPALMFALLAISYVTPSAADLGNQEQLFKLGRDHWAFQPVSKPAVPQLPANTLRQNAIDNFLRSKALGNRLQTAAPATPRVIIRRLFYGLTGLPPTYEEIAKWSTNWSPAKVEQLADHLLASKHYGEHWGRMWLDLARYADTKGYMGGGKERRYPFAYTYRDWVVNALNEDVPYDRFLKLQLAADRLQGDGVTSTNDLAALGFLTVGSRFSGKTDLVTDDRIDVVTRGTMGLTVTCARCHNHPYDPVPAADYYSLYGIFMNTSEPKDLPLLPRTVADPKITAAFDREYAKLQGAVDKFVKEKYDELRRSEIIAKYLRYQIDSRGWSRSKNVSESGKLNLHYRVVMRWTLGLQAAKKANLPQFTAWHAAAELYGDGKVPAAKDALTKLFNTSTNVNSLVKTALQKHVPESLGEFCDIYARILAAADGDQPHRDQPREALRQVLRNPAGPTGFPIDTLPSYFNRGSRTTYQKLEAKVDKLIATHSGSPPRAMVLEDVSRPRDSFVLKRGNPRLRGDKVPRQFLAILEDSVRKPFADGVGRRELGDKIASADNPLTARVMVNRLWMHHFGKPLVDTPSDFGLQAAEPLHLDLLDHLADYLVRHDWSLKQLHRHIVTSATYQQSSVTINWEDDPENRYFTRAERRRLSFEATRDSLLAVSGELDRSIGGRPVALEGSNPSRRRAIYGFIDRYEVAPTLRTFDFADPNLHAPKRPKTTVPQQALFFMNSPFVEARARRVMQRAAARGKNEVVIHMYRLIYGRDPSPAELKAARWQKPHGWLEIAQVLLASNEFSYLD